MPDKILLVDCKIKKKFLGIKPINIDMTIDNLDSLFGKPSKIEGNILHYENNDGMLVSMFIEVIDNVIKSIEWQYSID